jgi:hypothetical protein
MPQHLKRFQGLLAALAIAACAQATEVPAGATVVYRCTVNGQWVFQQQPCAAKDGKGERMEVRTSPAKAASASASASAASTGAKKPMPAAAEAVAPPASAEAPAKSGLDLMADTCLAWYQPRLRDPRSAYHRDARYEKGVLTLLLYATDARGGYVPHRAACEFRGGSLDEGWTRIQAQRIGW